jgi:hypothetical protein
MEFRLLDGPFDGVHQFSTILGEWLVLFADAAMKSTSQELAFALVAYKQDADEALVYHFKHCLTRDLKRFQILFADGPYQGSEVSTLPMKWLTSEIVRPLDAQARAIRHSHASSSPATYLSHYERRTEIEGYKYYLTKITHAPLTRARQAA